MLGEYCLEPYRTVAIRVYTVTFKIRNLTAYGRERSANPVRQNNQSIYKGQISNLVPFDSSTTTASTVWVVTEATVVEPLVCDWAT